jgi:fumarate hydratase class II
MLIVLWTGADKENRFEPKAVHREVNLLGGSFFYTTGSANYSPFLHHCDYYNGDHLFPNYRVAEMRKEKDSMGEIEVPDSALYGAHTQRALNNYCVNPRLMPGGFIRCLALIKAAAANANARVGVLEPAIAAALESAAMDISRGDHFDHFPVPVFQTGSGTSTNMNMNEVLARLASSSIGRSVHPNDHANCSQSSNDVIPSGIQVSTFQALHRSLFPALVGLIDIIDMRAKEFSNVVKTGRTHLMDAMPLTLGQEFSAWVHQLDECRARLNDAAPRMCALPIGGSAVGTGVNVPPGFASALVDNLNRLSGFSFTVAENRFSRMAGQDVALECSACLRALSVVLTKINNDLRWMSSGPLAGLAEIRLEALQPGSSIMPGKVNPVLPEAALMAAAEVVGNDTCVALAVQSGNFQLNVMLPLIADKLLQSIDLLVGACDATGHAIAGLEPCLDRIERTLSSNPILVTALNRTIGYEAAAAIAQRCYREGRPVLDVAVEETGLPRDELEHLLDPSRLTNAGRGQDKP